MRSYINLELKYLLLFVFLCLSPRQGFTQNTNKSTDNISSVKATIKSTTKSNLKSTKALPQVLPKKQIVTREVSNQVLKKPSENIVSKKVVLGVESVNKLAVNKSNTKKSVASKKPLPTKYRTLYVMVYKDKTKTHEFKFLKDVNNHKNTALKWKTNKKVITKRLPPKDAIHIERIFSKIWGDTKFRSPSRAKKCTPYVNVASLLGKQIVCAENQNTAFQARNFLNELNMVFKASK